VRTITTSVAGPKFKEQGAAVEEFWRRMETANGGRPGDPHDYINLVDARWDDGRGWVIDYEVPAELLEQHAVSVIREEPEPNCQNVLKTANLAVQPSAQVVKPRPKCHVLSCLTPCIEGSSYCAEHQDKESRAEARGAPTTTKNVEPVFESFDREQPVPVRDVRISGWNPRRAFDSEALQALADDIRQNDLINAVTVRPKGKSKYELVAGERRLRAFRLLGRATIPAKVRELTDEQMLDIMLAENLQRVDLNPIEEAHHLKRVFEVGKLTQTELGKRVGKSQEWVSQRLRLAEAPSALQDLIIRRQINTSSAIEMLQWKNTEHYDVIVQEVMAWTVAGEELPRARVREIIGQITEPANDHHCNECGNSHDSGDGVRVVCAHHGVVNGKGRGCEKWIGRKPRAATSDISGAPALNIEQPERPELCDQTPAVYTDVSTSTDPPFVNPEDQDLPSEPELVSDDDEDQPETPESKNDSIAKACQDIIERGREISVAMHEKLGDSWTNLGCEEKRSDFAGNKGIPQITDRTGSHGYWAQMVGNSNGNLTVRMGSKGAHHELEGIVAEAIGCEEGDHVPVAIEITRGTIVIRRRGKF